MDLLFGKIHQKVDWEIKNDHEEKEETSHASKIVLDDFS